ncbi:MAG: phosphatase PAP2 family protein [Candidatus Magasanikbacteria bacterium]|nr:phosphatase PAP2 family protein [Candidatus Magasanikbacteria bacterium]
MFKNWNKNLFFWANDKIGKNRYLDYIMLFFSHWLIYALAFLVLFWGVFLLSESEPQKFILLVKLILTGIFFAISLNFLIGILWVNRRPIVDNPDIKQLFTPYKTWKSFPSDHTTIAFILATIPFLIGANLLFFLLCIFFAFCIGVARVYAGVHYPRDIIGGIIIGFFFSFFSFWLLDNVSQPLYSLVKSFFV